MTNWENAPSDFEIKNNNLFGFVYLIERINALDGEPRYYWGCKQFWNKKKMPALKGKVKKRIKYVPSDWKDYWGSSNELLSDIKKYGNENFTRKVLKICDCKWELKYEELKVQMENDVLFRSDVYNGILHVRLGNAPKLIKEKNENRNL
jgi:hypothetical protein